ncbi:IclR family transcriptional regulator [Streptomyces sp. NPDC127068]|uniref:IclR family transcriptional regulator n=1 Tax=Streptomyces sp. NPDC127068 TaxID=3347127 RepID=UPI0036537E1B
MTSIPAEESPSPKPAAESRLAIRMVNILRAVQAGGGVSSLADIVEFTGLAKSTVHRLLNNLQHVQLLERDGEQYRLGVALYQLAARLDDERYQLLRHLLKPLLLRLHEETRQLVGLAVTSGTRTRFLELMYSQQYSHLARRFERPAPLHATTPGKALLAYAPRREGQLFPSANRASSSSTLPQGLLTLSAVITGIRERGYVLERDEHLGIATAAAPVGRPGAWPLSVLSISAHVDADWVQRIAVLRGGVHQAREILLRSPHRPDPPSPRCVTGAAADATTAKRDPRRTFG